MQKKQTWSLRLPGYPACARASAGYILSTILPNSKLQWACPIQKFRESMKIEYVSVPVVRGTHANAKSIHLTLLGACVPKHYRQQGPRRRQGTGVVNVSHIDTVASDTDTDPTQSIALLFGCVVLSCPFCDQ